MWIEQGLGVKWANPRKRNDPRGMCILEPGPTFKRVPRASTHHPLERMLQYRVRRIETRRSTRITSSRVTGPLISDLKPRAPSGFCGVCCSKTDWSDTGILATIINKIQQEP